MQGLGGGPAIVTVSGGGAWVAVLPVRLRSERSEDGSVTTYMLRVGEAGEAGHINYP